ncbi:MAG: response regulator [Methanolinea sp.]|nr:response regulator [Methanolinea sp.]
MISILLVDDEVQFLEVTKMFLEKGRGIRVTTATSGDEALEILKNQKFDAIISDYAMPGMNGIEFMKRVKALGDDTPFIIFTGKGREDVVIDALNFGADLYLEKSPDVRGQVADVVKKVRNLISARSEDREEKERCRYLHILLEKLPCALFWQKEGDAEASVLAGDAASTFLPASLCRGKVQKHDILGWVHPEDREKVRHARSEAFRKAKEYEVRYVLQRRPAEERRVMERGFPTLRPDGYFIEGYILDLDFR